MTDQIKQTQITPTRQLRQNPSEALPRDLIVDYVDPIPVALGNYIVPDVNIPQEAATNIVPTPVTDANYLDTPMYQSIKTQNISYQGDGSIAVDVVITVTDIIGATEYEIRITKDAGLL